jgi:hypothetical protein
VRVRLGRDENQRQHALRYALAACLDALAVQRAIELNLEGVSLSQGLNKRDLLFGATLLCHHAFKFPDGDVNVGRITIEAPSAAKSTSQRGA